MTVDTDVLLREGLVEIDGRTHSYLFAGPEGAQPVVILHGIMGHRHEWDAVTRTLAESYRVYALDQRGHGDSDWTDHYSPAAMADDLIEFVDHLAIERPHLIGHSMGGMVSMIAGSRRPDRFGRIVVVDIGPDSVVGPDAELLRQWIGELGAKTYRSEDDAYREWVGDPFARPELLRHYASHCLRETDEGLRWKFDGEALTSFFDNVSEEELWTAVETMSNPTLLVRGAHSPHLSEATASAMIERMAAADLWLIPDGAHDLGVERPGQVAEAALRFFG